MIDYNPRENFEKEVCNPCELKQGCYLNKRDCYEEYLEKQNKQMLEVLEEINDVINDGCVADAQAMLKTIIETITGKKIEEN